MAQDALEPDQVPSVRRLVYLSVGFPIAMVAGAFALVRFNLGWAGVAVMIVIAMAGTVALARAAQFRAQSLGCVSPAMVRYNNRMGAASLAYMAILFGAVYAYAQLQVRGPLLWVVAIGTIVPVLVMIWAMARLLVEEDDEYLRARIVRQALFGLGGVLIVTTVWGFLEQFMLVPHVPSWAVMPLFAVMVGVSSLAPANRG